MLIFDAKFTNPLIKTSSPDVGVDLIISRIVSSVSEDFLRMDPFCCAKASIIWNFVRVMRGSVKLNMMVLVTGAPLVDQINAYDMFLSSKSVGSVGFSLYNPKFLCNNLKLSVAVYCPHLHRYFFEKEQIN